MAILAQANVHYTNNYHILMHLKSYLVDTNYFSKTLLGFLYNQNSTMVHSDDAELSSTLVLLLTHPHL